MKVELELGVVWGSAEKLDTVVMLSYWAHTSYHFTSTSTSADSRKEKVAPLSLPQRI